MGKIFKNLINQGKYVILFGEKNLEKINFAESLCVYLYERKIISNYEIIRIFNENDYKYMEEKLYESYKYNNRIKIKNSIIVKFDIENDIYNYEFLIQIYQKYLIENNENNFYFIFIFDTKDEKAQDNEIRKETFINYFIKKIKEEHNKKLIFNINEEKNNIFYAGFNSTKYKFQYQGKREEDNKNKNIRPKEKINLSKEDSLYFFYFLIYNMPSGLPAKFLELIFDNYYNIKYNKKIIGNSNINNWKIIKDKKQFQENFKETKNIEICYEYIFKTLKIYTTILNCYINKNKKKVNNKGGIMHYIFNSYSYNNI